MKMNYINRPINLDLIELSRRTWLVTCLSTTERPPALLQPVIPAALSVVDLASRLG